MTGPTLLAISSFLSRILGVVRSNRFAAYFGVGTQSDAYFAAFQITDLVYNLIIFGAISAAFIPLFSKYIAKKDMKNAWEFTNNLLNFLLLIVLIVSIVIFFFAPFILQVLYPGFSEETLATTTKLVRIMIVAPMFFGISGICGSIQNSFHTFWAYSISPLLYNLSIIFGIIYLSPHYGIFGVAYGVVIGAFLHMAIQLPVIFRKGFRYKFYLDLKRKDFRKTMVLAIPRIFGMAVYQVNFLIEGFLASMIAFGSLTVFRLAQDLQSFPIGIIGLSIAISSFGVISKFIANEQYEKFNEYIHSNIRKILFLSIPASIGLFVLRIDIVSLILNYGRFTAENVALTANILGIFCVSLTFLSIIPLLSRAFYALHDTKTPVVIGGITLCINLLLGLILIEYLGIAGLAIAGMIAAFWNFHALIFMLEKRIKLHKKRLFDSLFFLKILVSSLIMGVFVLLLNILFTEYLSILELLKNVFAWFSFDKSSLIYPLGLFIKILFLSIIGAIVYFLLTFSFQENRLLREKIGLKGK